MRVTWMLFSSILLGLLAHSSTATATARDCTINHVLHCYDTLTDYEGQGFPFYGRDHLALEETCRLMNDSFNCVEVYLDWCKGRSECDEDCQQVIEDIEIFSNNTGLRHAQKEICNPKSSLRHAYLDNYACLESNEKRYADCHNVSNISQEYMIKITDPIEEVAAKCCFFAWFHDCFTNITRETCNENATFFVSYTITTLLSQMSIPYYCGSNPDVCDTPPLPSNEEEETDPLHEEHDTTDVDNSLDKEHKSWEDSPKKDHSLESEHNFTDIDNSLESQPKSPGTSRTYSIWTITMSFFVLFSCCML